jgi:long-subunit acyl-CoA synthetase (AMP-forming)
LTETSGAITIMAEGVDVSDVASEVSIGRLCPNARAKVVDDDGGALPLGSVGELWLQSPQVMGGYLGNQEATDTTITPDGWLRTGDVARFAPDGSVFIVDRLKELIKVKGFQVR